MESNPKARSNPKALHTLDGYKRGLVNSLTGNLQRLQEPAKPNLFRKLHQMGRRIGDERTSAYS
jgi:hypothetical protein